ncbi:hypothetical protein WMF37_02335 [Sorangium sp. So ce291]|uniref:hypothetical protein n=1 Tax=Sorangium sp. So ce291 TaxID=3133294 RepID=UPI003F61DAA6
MRAVDHKVQGLRASERIAHGAKAARRRRDAHTGDILECPSEPGILILRIQRARDELFEFWEKRTPALARSAPGTEYRLP